MTSRVILRRRRIFSDYLNVSARSIQSFQNLGHGSSNKYVDSHNFSSLANQCLQGSDSSKNRDEVQVKEGLLKFTTSGLLWQRCNGFIFSGYSIRKLDLISPTRLRFMSESAHYSSTATEKQPDFGSYDERNEELVAKTRKEASPQDCDEAVVDLSAAKAKPKEKRLQESQKVAMSILKRVWATMLGIGPALRAVASMSREDWAKKLIHWKLEFKSTLQHYWLGTKLLWADVRISSRLLLRLAGGKSLSRMERQQLTRTTADIFRLVPFAVFIIVPFMEFFLPVFLKLFPNMLPSSFQDKMKAEEALVRRLNARIEYAKFLQETAREMAWDKNSCSGEIKKTAEDLDEFLNRVRRGAGVTNEEILGFAKLFNDVPTLDNISRPWLLESKLLEQMLICDLCFGRNYKG